MLRAALLAWLLAWPVIAAASTATNETPRSTAAVTRLPGPVTLAAGENKLALNQGQVAVLRDPSGHLTLEQVMAAADRHAFTPLHGNLGFGYTRDVIWLRIAIHRDATEDPTSRWWLEVLPSFLDRVDFYLQHANGRIESIQTGDVRLRAEHHPDFRTILLPLNSTPGDYVAWLRIESSSSMVGVLRLWREPALVDASLSQYLLHGLYLGLLTAVLLLIAINWLLLRTPLYLLYLGYIGMLLMHGVASSGLASQYLIPAYPEIPDLMVGLGMAMASAFGLAFFDRMLDMDPIRNRRLRQLYMVSSVVALLTAIAVITGYYLYLAPALQICLLLVILCTLPLGWARVRNGRSTQRLAGLAFFTYALLLLISSLSYLGLFPTSEFSITSGHLGNLAHLFLLHAALTLRVRDHEREHESLVQQAEITRKEMEQERQRRTEHDQFLSMVAHEIRTPISVIDAATQSLQLLDEKPPAERTIRYDRIQRAVHRLKLLVELALHQVRPGTRQGVGQNRCDLVDLSCDVIDHFEPPQNQQINVVLGCEQAPVFGRAEMLGFILINLLDNACKYSPPHSPVDIELQPETRNGHAGFCWRITDHGMGVAEADRQRIFDKYYRSGDGSGTAGLGLGLYIAHHIAEQAGGTLRCVEAPTGCGARFECWLPRSS